MSALGIIACAWLVVMVIGALVELLATGGNL